MRKTKLVFNCTIKILLVFTIFAISASAVANNECNCLCGFDEYSHILNTSNSTINITYLDTTQLKIELSNDGNFKELHEYARELGYIYPSKITKTIHGNLTVINAIMTSIGDDFIFLTKLSLNNQSHSMLMSIDNTTITLLDKDGGMVIDANGSVSTWCTHHSCNFWDCFPVCMGSKAGENWWSLLGDTLKLATSCPDCVGACGAFCVKGCGAACLGPQAVAFCAPCLKAK